MKKGLEKRLNWAPPITGGVKTELKVKKKTLLIAVRLKNRREKLRKELESLDIEISRLDCEICRQTTNQDREIERKERELRDHLWNR